MATIILFGHGQYSSVPTNIKATCTLRFYGPFGAFLTRAVARAIIEHRGKMAQGCTKLISNASFNKLLREFGGVCPSFDRALWDKASQNPLTHDVVAANDVPNLTLLPDKEESGRYESMPDVRIVKKATHLYEIQNEYKPEDVLIWAACSDIGGKETPDQQSVILDPTLASDIYPPTEQELKIEKEYRQLQENEKAVTGQTFQPTKRQAVDIPEALQKILNLEFKATDDLDDQVKRLQPHLTKFNVKQTTVLRWMGENGIKGDFKEAPKNNSQNETLFRST